MTDILGDIADPKFREFVKKHWPWFLAGGLGLAYVAYLYFSSSSSSTSSTASTTTSASPYVYTTSSGSGTGTTDDTALNDQTQLALGQVAAQVQAYGDQLNAYTSVTNQSTVTQGENYQTLVNASAVQNNTLAATAAQQNIDMAQALEQGFSSYATSTAQIASSAASGAASTAAANDAANGSNVLSGVLSGVGSIVAGLNNPLSALTKIGGLSGVSTSVNIPLVGGGVTNTSSKNGVTLIA